jgi:uncharacterized damage-inducible protein DinB
MADDLSLGNSTPRIQLDPLLQYTDWERSTFHAWFAKFGNEPLQIEAGPHGDGRFTTIGDLIRHTFSAEKRYVERLCSMPLSDVSEISTADAEALFALGDDSRAELLDLLKSFPSSEWDRAREFEILTFRFSATPRKIITHVLMHEVRHWAQISTILRLHGHPTGFHDFLFSPVYNEAK